MIKVNLNKSTLINSDCLEALKLMPENSIDSVVTDAPYGLSFMGKKWDYDVPSSEIFKEILRVLKPGGHMLCACGTRTQHRMAVNIEDAGFEIRDVITWLYGSGFPKSMDISKAIDKAAGAEREVIGSYKATGTARNSKHIGEKTHSAMGDYEADVDQIYQTAPATDAAKKWQGWGTALKPACEFWTLARKPLSEKTVAANVLEHGTGGINIDGCRVETQDKIPSTSNPNIRSGSFNTQYEGRDHEQYNPSPLGRWPANLILDEEAAKVLDEQTEGTRASKPSATGGKFKAAGAFPIESNPVKHEDSGGASRFFYVAKASKNERNEGLEHLPERSALIMNGTRRRCPKHDGAVVSGGNVYTCGCPILYDQERESVGAKNNHPTVKPIKLMTYLCRLITPPNGIVLDPFMGSGSTGVAAVKEGFGFVGIERESAYFEICKARIESA